MKIDSRPLDDLGDPHAEPGSKPWAVWVANEIRVTLYDKQQSGARLQSLTQSFKDHDGYKPLGYRTWPDFCKRKLQTTPDEVEEQIELRKVGRPIQAILAKQDNLTDYNPDNCKVYNMSTDYGNSSTYLAARLARDFPDTLTEVKQGKYRSMHAAAKAVGIVKDKPRISIDGADMTKAAALLASRLEQKQLAALISELVKRLDDDQLEWLDNDTP